MKKISIVSVVIVYILAFIVVGFFGIELKVEDPVIYATNIEWDSKELEKDNHIKITKYEEKTNGVNAKLVYKYTESISGGLKINFKTYCKPLEATNTKLSYYMDPLEGVYKYEVRGDNTVDVTFYEEVVTKLLVKTTDGSNITYIIDLLIIDFS